MSFWVEEDLQILLDKLMEETGVGRIHFAWKNDNIFQTIAAHLLNLTGKPYTTEMVVREYYRLHGRYWFWNKLSNQNLSNGIR
ncbi:hypothetical protein ACJIZ3_005990 [Penstemon smallii]|uniref:Uncharacterized protein n=1 Tax=Penstemon smallii TaxID=265156 RepID=A0ABD3S6F6_9LAMI